MNRLEFVRLLGPSSTDEYFRRYAGGEIATLHFETNKFVYDYRYALYQFFKQRGCKIIYHGKGMEGFILRVTPPTKAITIDEFISSFKKGVYISSLDITIIRILVVFAIIALFVKYSFE